MICVIIRVIVIIVPLSPLDPHDPHDPRLCLRRTHNDLDRPVGPIHADAIVWGSTAE
jgi:hypothetical protein